MPPRPVKTRWAGRYFDGQQAGHRKVEVAILPSGLQIVLEGGRAISWPYAEIRQTQGEMGGEHVRLERGGELGEVLVIRDPAFLGAVKAIAPQARLHTPLAGGRFALVVAGSVVAAIGVAAAWYLYGIPALADAVAERVPVALEGQWGAMVAEQLAPEKDRLDDPVAIAALTRIVDRLAAAHPSPYHFRVAIARTDEINAFAAPGGYIVVNRGLLRRTRRPEELAGVLAHEMQHVYHRHTTRILLRAMSVQAILGALAGDAGTLGQAAGAVGSLGLLGYQRSYEAQADADGMRLMQDAKVDPRGMIAVFETLQREAKDVPAGLAFLSNHPATGDRIAELKGLAAERTVTPVAIALDRPWDEVVGRVR